MEGAARRYLVHIRIGPSKPPPSRIAEAAKGIHGAVRDMSNGEFQLAYTSEDGATFGFFLKAKISAAQIRARIDSPGRDNDATAQPSVFLSDDAMLIVELGEDFDGIGFSRAWAWLQRH